jgi:hypothetical protein
LQNSSDQKSVGTVPAHDACPLECHDAKEQDVQESGKQKNFLAVNPVLTLGKNAGSGSSCPSEKAGSGSMVLRAENLKKCTTEIFFNIYF